MLLDVTKASWSASLVNAIDDLLLVYTMLDSNVDEERKGLIHDLAGGVRRSSVLVKLSCIMPSSPHFR